jgi:septation ring formation regulator EzrA
VQKVVVYALVAFIIFGGGVLTGNISASGDIKDVENRIGVIQGKLDESSELVESLRSENIQLRNAYIRINSENQQLRNIIEELQELNERFRRIVNGISEANSAASEGIRLADAGIGNVTDGISSYIKKAESQE